jgi:hypothetical protein
VVNQLQLILKMTQSTPYWMAGEFTNLLYFWADIILPNSVTAVPGSGGDGGHTLVYNGIKMLLSYQ